ncbi:MAG TPA: nuclear transport factor 2 family protein [Terriglobia bacterium]|nr:nuclear transport factor 2 family protein [Terriglobia bacterium]
MFSKSVLIGALAAVGVWSGLTPVRQSDPLPDLAARIERSQAQIENIESVRAIKRLQYAYGHYVEFGLWNDFADLFTADAQTNYQQGARGREEVRKLFFDQVGQGKLGLADGRIYPHILFQPVVHLAPDGHAAKGRWRILAMLGGLGGSATWYSGVYENEYVLENGVWKISVLRSEPRVTAAYTAAGWRDSGTQVPPHYTAESVARPIPDAVTAARPAGAPTLQSLAGRVSELARRAALLQGQAEVTNLLDTYGYAIDRRQWDQAAGLFASDGTLELGQQGVYIGPASIRRGLAQSAEGDLNDHVYLQTLVSVGPDGRTAKARGVELIFSSGSGGELSEGVFENTFVKQNGAWKIQSVRFYPRMIVDAAAGWARSSKPVRGPSKETPPDRPPTTIYEIYPKFTVAPFHFDNPVTGKAPQYPEGTRPARSATTVAAPASDPVIRNAAELEARLAEVERSVASAEVYDIAENLIGAHGYSLDGSPAPNGGTIFASQTLQPVIDIAPDGKTAKVRARLLNPVGASGGPGFWLAGALEGEIVSEQNSWKLQNARSSTAWTAPYPGGWAGQ